MFKKRLISPFYKTLKSLVFIATFFGLLSQNTTAQTTVVKTDVGYSFMRDGKPYYVKGSGGEVNLDKAVAIGSNSIRTWGIDNAQEILDEAQKRGLTVMLGFWLQHERHGFDYNDKEKVARQLAHFKTVIDKFKNHPALLMWGIGNELNLQYSNPNCWNAVQDIAKYAHDVDKNHPTSTVTAGLDSMVLQEIVKRVPDMDVFCINTYGDIPNVPSRVEKFGWAGPYMITEWGPNGYWESPKTAWETSIEQTSTEKKQVYFDRYKQYIAPFPKCLGSYSFLWGEKQEYTETWFGLFSKDNLPTEPVDALEMVYLDKNPEKASPKVLSITLNNQKATDNIKIKADDKFTAQVTAKIGINMTEEADDTKHALRYEWKILAESTDKKSGGDAEEAAKEVTGLIQNAKKANINFRAPHKSGAYRIFVSIYLNGKVAYANIPFWVDERTEADGQAHFVEFKKATMTTE
jgi:Glycosyl hydrolases family 2, TIM barrel domain